MYVRLTKGLNDVGRLIPKQDNPYNYIKDIDTDYYLSIYEYNEEQKNRASELITIEGKERARGVSGINDVVTDCLAFDFDSSDLEAARTDTITLVDRLIENGVDKKAIKVSFSGNKGFSVVVNHTTELSPEKHKQIAASLAGDLESFDTKIYNASRIFRLDYTRHSGSQLYKTPIGIQGLKTLSIEKIKKNAAIKKEPAIVHNPTKLPEKLLQLKEKETPKVLVDLEIKEEVDFTQKPAFLSKAKFVLHKGHIPEGYGNTAFMILAATYKKAGFDKNDAFNMLWSVNEKRAAIYGQDKKRSEDAIMHEVVNVVYGPTWSGGTYSEKDNELLASINEKYQVNIDDKKDDKLVNLTDITSVFRNFAENIDENTIKIGIPEIDKNYRITTSMLVCLVASPSAGKTAVSLGILETLSKNNIDSLFLSLDMGVPLIYQRLIQRNTGYDSDKVFNAYKNKDTQLISKMEQQVTQNYKNVSFCFKSGIQIEDIRLMLMEEKKNGKNIRFLAVDYLECLQGPFSDAHANLGFVAQSLKDIANEFDICVFLLVQPQKHAGDPSDEITSYRGIKGNSATEQAASIVMSISRPGFDPKFPDEDVFMTLNVLKNRMGRLGTHDFYWDGVTGKISSLDEEGRGQLKTLREQVALRKKSKEEKPF